MATTEEFELFEGKSLSSLFKDIYDNSVDTKKQLKALIAEVAKMIDDQASAASMVPIIKEYLDINVRNDEHLIKLAMIVQRLIASESKGGSEDAFGLSDSEKAVLLENAETAMGLVRADNENVKKLKQKVAGESEDGLEEDE